MRYAILANKINKKAPDWIRVAFTGEWNGEQEFSLEPADLKDMVKNFYASGREFPVDWEHASLDADRAPAAGWIKNLEVRGNELWANVEWNEDGRADIESGAYKYLSPVIIWNKTDNKTGELLRCYLHSVALTNSPYIQELKIAASDKLALCSAGKLGNGKGEELDCSVFSENQKEKGTMKEVLKALGLAENATEQEALAKVMELQNAIAPAAAALGEGTPVDIDSVKSGIAALKDGAAKDQELIKAKNDLIAAKDQTIEDLTIKVELKDAERLIDGAILNGKMIPSEKQVYLDRIALRDENGESVGMQMLMETINSRKNHNLFAKSAALSNKAKTEKLEIDPEIRRLSNLSDEDFEKFGPKGEY